MTRESQNHLVTLQGNYSPYESAFVLEISTILSSRVLNFAEKWGEAGQG